MNDRQTVLTDERLAQVLRSRTAEPDPEMLSKIVREAERTKQASLWWVLGLRAPMLSTLGVAAVAVAVIAVIAMYLAAIGAVNRVGGPTPTPETTLLFQTPFEYTLRDDGDLRISELGEIESPVENLDSLAVVFTAGTGDGDRGVTVAQPAGSTFPWCFGDQLLGADATVEDVLADSWLGLQPLGEPTASTEKTIDGRAAVTIWSPSGRCPSQHPWERESISPEPGYLTFLDVDGVVVVVSVWGHTDAVLADWLPEANGFVQTIHFLGGRP
ncbi:MAG TPA: hypothetical protein VJ839_02115 [Candidatus Limnocylindria bacterium]|nr:hypothetical protein [Candidatus Limnocylindria bacterium]